MSDQFDAWLSLAGHIGAPGVKPCGCNGHKSGLAAYGKPVKKTNGVGAIALPVTGVDVEALNTAIETLLADINRTVSKATPDELTRLIVFQSNYVVFKARWSAWYAQNQETWVTLAQKLTVPVIAIVLSQKQDEEFGAFRSEFSAHLQTWTTELGQKTSATTARPGLPAWVYLTGAAIAVIGLGILLGPAIASFLMQRAAQKAAAKVAVAALPP